jgi:hypothetical protein
VGAASFFYRLHTSLTINFIAKILKLVDVLAPVAGINTESFPKPFSTFVEQVICTPPSDGKSRLNAHLLAELVAPVA